MFPHAHLMPKPGGIRAASNDYLLINLSVIFTISRLIFQSIKCQTIPPKNILITICHSPKWRLQLLFLSDRQTKKSILTLCKLTKKSSKSLHLRRSSTNATTALCLKKWEKEKLLIHWNKITALVKEITGQSDRKVDPGSASTAMHHRQSPVKHVSLHIRCEKIIDALTTLYLKLWNQP